LCHSWNGLLFSMQAAPQLLYTVQWLAEDPLPHQAALPPVQSASSQLTLTLHQAGKAQRVTCRTSTSSSRLSAAILGRDTVASAVWASAAALEALQESPDQV
jgi:hypothetical protein